MTVVLGRTPEPAPVDPAAPHLAAYQAHAAAVAGLYDRGGHITRADVKAAMDALTAALATIERSSP